MFEENLSIDTFKGVLARASSDTAAKGAISEAKERKEEVQKSSDPNRPQLHAIISAADFEDIAKTQVSPKTWAFYSSAATDLVTHRQNKDFLRRIMIQPRILRDVRHVDISRKILGCESQTPFFISPAAMARLVHPDGELSLAKGAAAEGIIQCVGSCATLKSAFRVFFFLVDQTCCTRFQTTPLILLAQ